MQRERFLLKVGKRIKSAFVFVNLEQLLKTAIDFAVLIFMFVSALGTLFLIARNTSNIHVQNVLVETFNDLANVSRNKPDVGTSTVARMAVQLVAQMISYGLVILFGTLKVAIASFYKSENVVIQKQIVCENQSEQSSNCKRCLVVKHTHVVNLNIVTRLLS